MTNGIKSVLLIMILFGIISITVAGKIETDKNLTGLTDNLTGLTDREIANKSGYFSNISKEGTILQTGDTIFTPASDSDKNIKFTKTSGDDLDQYLFRDATPIDVYIDVGDLNPDPSITQKPKLTLRYWDVDRTGPSVSACKGGPEIDTIALNGYTLPGELTGQSDEWNIKTYTLEPGWIKKGQNHFTLNIDTTATDCWAVQVDWVEIKIPFNIKVTKIEAFDDLDILNNAGTAKIPDVIWEKKFDGSGNLIDVGPPATNYPIADWFKSNKFKFKVTVDVWPKFPPNFVPKVTHWWENFAKVGTVPTISSPVLNFDGKNKELEVDLPQKVGQREIIQVFIFKRSDGKKVQTDAQDTRHKLYVTINKALDITNVNGPNPKMPKERWLDIATKWAVDADTEDKGIAGIFSKEYGAPPNEFGWRYPTGYINWNMYKGIDSTGDVDHVNHGECYIHRDVLRALSGVLGVKTDKNDYIETFITGLKPALDNNKYAPARNTTVATKPYDRWVFGSHAQVIYGNYWDVTFGRTYGAESDAADAIYHHKTPAGVLVFKKGAKTCNVVYKGPGAGAGKDGWSLYDYACSPPPNVEIATETGDITYIKDYGLDTDSDTLYNYLVANISIKINTAGAYGIVGDLNINNSSFLGSLDTKIKSQSPSIYKNYTVGDHKINMYFAGKKIYESKTNGKYTVNVTLLNKTGAIVKSISNKTSSYNYNKFQGLKFLIYNIANNITDYGNDTNADGKYDYLTVAINATVPGNSSNNVRITGFLENKTQNTQISYVDKAFVAKNGQNLVIVNFNGNDIRQKRLNGPYDLTLVIADNNYNDVINKKTNAYSYTKFGRPPAEFSMVFSDSGKDINSNGLFDFLDINVGLNITTPGTYKVLGWLTNSTGDIINSADNSSSLTAGSKTLTLRFSGKDIYRAKTNGTYNLTFLRLLDNAGNIIDSPATNAKSSSYRTKKYNYTQFERPKAMLTGKFSDIGIDTNSNGLFDILKVSTQLNIATAGNYRIDAFLADKNGKIVDDINTTQFLSAGVRNASLNFSGKKIFLNRVNGTFNIKFIRVYSGICTNPATCIVEDYKSNIYTTINYNYTKFERPQIYISGYTDSAIDTDSNSLYNFLRIGIRMTPNITAFYSINARIVDSLGNEIGWTSNNSYLINVSQTVYLNFDGFNIRGNGINGPYYLQDLSIYDINGNGLFIDNAYRTSFYDYTKFENPGFIKGYVKYKNGTAIKNAVVFYSGYYSSDTDLTDSNGRYSLIVSASGTYDIIVIPPVEWSLVQDSKSVGILIGDTKIVNFTLYKPSSISGRILDKDNRPVSGATILFSGPDDYTNYSDSQGNYLVSKMRHGFYNITVTPPYGVNLIKNETNITISPESTNKFDIKMPEGGVIKGFVNLLDGTTTIPLEDMIIYASNSTTGTYRYDYSDIYGGYNIIALPTGNYSVSVSRYGLDGNNTFVQVIVGKTSVLNISLKPILGVVTGIIKVDSLPLEGFQATLTKDSSYNYDYANFLGRYYFFGLNNGTYNLTVDPYYYYNVTSNHTTVNVTTGNVSKVDIKLKTNGSIISGIVTDMVKNPIYSAYVTAIGTTSYGAGYTSQYGRYTIFNLINETYTVTVNPPYGSDLIANSTSAALKTGTVTIRDFMLKDSTPPENITGLKNITYKRTYINWTWKDPFDTDLKHVMVYINGIWKSNVTKGKMYYNSTGLDPNTLYKISTRTVDLSDNINQAWVNKTARTAP